MTRTPRIQRIDVLVAAGATAWILLIQTLSLVLWRRHPLLCQVIVWVLQLLLLAGKGGSRLRPHHLLRAAVPRRGDSGAAAPRLRGFAGGGGQGSRA